MNKLFLTLLIVLPLAAMGQKPLMQWDFESLKNRKSIEVSTNIADTIEGNFEQTTGIIGHGLRLDGFTTRVIRQAANLKKPGSEFTIEGWVALGEYPWNWCPFITTESDEIKGYRLMIGPMGQLYNLETDPGETVNLYFKHPEIVRELKALMESSKAL